MKKKTIIVGARKDGHAKVVLKILLHHQDIEVVGFIDDDPMKKGQMIENYPILGALSELNDLKMKLGLNAGIVAIGDNKRRRELTQELKNLGLELVNAIHPSVICDDDVEMGRGNYLGQGVILVTGTKIGNAVNIHTGATIDHDNVIEDGANLGPGVHTSGRVRIGRDAFVGVGSSLIPDVVVGEGAIVGGGSVIIRDVQPFTKMVGNPARVIPM